MTTEAAQKILIQYLEHYLPADDSDQNVILKSSQDIADDLADIVLLDLNTIAEVMEPVYRIRFDDGNIPKWAMLPRE